MTAGAAHPGGVDGARRPEGGAIRGALRRERAGRGIRTRSARSGTDRRCGMNSVPEVTVRPPRLDAAAAKPANALIRGAKVIDPRSGIDGNHDLLIRGGEIAEIGAPGSLEAPAGTEVIEAERLHAFPAFVDPHVHLRTPGRDDEEDIESGT